MRLNRVAGFLALGMAIVAAAHGTGLWAAARHQSSWSADDQKMFCDPDGLIVHRDVGPSGTDNGGDTAQREDWYWLGVWLRSNTEGLKPWAELRQLTFNQVLKLMEPKQDGVFYRHPKMSPYNNPFDKTFGTSRDLLIPLIAAMGVWGKKSELRHLWNALPESIIGKRAFNGNWRHFLGQDRANCSDIKRRDCDATADCSLKTDTRSCPLQADNRDCSLQVDSRDCYLHQDTRDCSYQTIFGGRYNDPACKAAKATQNQIYAANKASCEAAKASQNLIYKGNKDACDLTKVTDDQKVVIGDGIQSGWKAETSCLYGAARWYHRPESSGASPALRSM